MNAARIRRFRERTQTQEDAANPCRVRIDGGNWVPASTVCLAPSELDLAVGGPRSKAPRVVRIRKEYFTAQPKEDATRITIEGMGDFRVTKLDGEQPSSPAWLCTCDPWTR